MPVERSGRDWLFMPILTVCAFTITSLIVVLAIHLYRNRRRSYKGNLPEILDHLNGKTSTAYEVSFWIKPHNSLSILGTLPSTHELSRRANRSRRQVVKHLILVNQQLCFSNLLTFSGPTSRCSSPAILTLVLVTLSLHSFKNTWTHQKKLPINGIQ